MVIHCLSPRRFLTRFYSHSPITATAFDFFNNRRIEGKSFSFTTMSLQSSLEKAKQLAAIQAVDEHVKDNQVVGIGSGSTVIYAVQRIAERVKSENLKLICIPTSFQAKNLIIQHNLQLSDLNVNPQVDVTIDGCDECDQDLNLIKGGGGCHLQEKIVASASDKLIIIGDYTKDSTFLGQNWKKGIPLEVSQIGWSVVLKKLDLLVKSFKGVQLEKTTQPRAALQKMGPVVTDGGNFIVDFQIGNLFESQKNVTPKSLNALLRTIPGILETGLFVEMASQVYFGHDDGTVTTRCTHIEL